MAETIYVVTRNEQDQYVRLLDLADSTAIYAVRDTFKPVLAGRQASIVGAESRRGGSVQVAERRDTASIGGTFMVKGSTPDLALNRAESLLSQADSAARDRWVWWQPEGATRISLYPLVGPASASTLNYTWAQFASGFFPIDVSWPCQPWTEGLVQDMGDDFRNRDAASALAQWQRDYTPLSAVTPTSVGQSALEFPANLTAAQARIPRLDRLPFRDGWVTVGGRAKTGATDSNYAVTPGIRYTPADGKYFFATFETGTLRVYEFDGSANVSRASVAQANPAVGTDYWLRIRAEGSSVIAEYWTVNPWGSTTPTQTVTYTNAATVRTGYPMLSANKMNTGAANIPVLTQFESRPYSWGGLTTPAVTSVEPLPGTMVAGTDIDLVDRNASPPRPRAVAFAWRRARPGTTPGAINKSMLIQAESPLTTGGAVTPTNVSDGTRYKNGVGLEFSLTNATTSAWAQWSVDSLIFEPDDFARDVTVAVMARYYRSSTAIVTPRLRAELQIGGIVASYTPEFGTTGRFIPLVGTGIRTTVLGTLRVPLSPITVGLTVTVFWAAGTTAATVIGLDELYLVPIYSTAMSATGKARDDGTYPTLFPSLGYERRFYTNRSSQHIQRVNAVTQLIPGAANLGGADLLLPTGTDGLGVEFLTVPMAAVPDDPVTNATESVSHLSELHLRITPRYHAFAA